MRNLANRQVVKPVVNKPVIVQQVVQGPVVQNVVVQSGPLIVTRSIKSTLLPVSQSTYLLSQTTVNRVKSVPLTKQMSFVSGVNLVPNQYAISKMQDESSMFNKLYQVNYTPDLATKSIVVEKEMNFKSQVSKTVMGSSYKETSFVQIPDGGQDPSKVLKKSASLDLSQSKSIKSSTRLSYVKTKSSTFDIMVNYENYETRENEITVETYPQGTGENVDIKNICASDQVNFVNVAGQKDKDKMPGGVVASTQTWIDIYISYSFVHSNKIDISSLTKTIIVDRKSLVSKLDIYLKYLTEYNKKNLHLFGTNYLGYRVYQVIDYFKSVMGWKVTGGAAAYSKNIDKFILQINKYGISDKDYEILLSLLRADLKIDTQTFNLYKAGYLADSTVMASWTAYIKTVQTFKLPLCQAAYEVLKLFSGDASYITLAQAIYENPDEDVKKQTIGHKIYESKAYWSNFGWLLEKEHRPDNCVPKDSGDNIHEMIQFIKIKKVLTTLKIFSSQKSFFGTYFFEFIKSGDYSQFTTIVDYDWFLICRAIDTTAITNLIKWIPFSINFHWEFFEDLFVVIFQKYGSDGKSPEAVAFKDINYLYVFFEYWKSGGTLAIQGDYDEIEHYSNVLIYIYKLYVIMRSDQKVFPIPSPFNVAAFYKVMYTLIHQMREWDDVGNFFGAFIIREHFAIYYPSVLNFICMKIGGTFCDDQPDDDLKQQGDKIKIIVKPDPDPYWIKYYIIIKIRRMLEFYRIDIDLKTFEESWMKLEWSLPKCARIERGEILERKYVIKNNVKVRDETRVKVIVYSKDCTADLYTAWWALITTIITKTWIKETAGFEKFWIVFLRLIEMSEGFRKETVRFLIIRLIRITFLDKKVDIKKANPILWQIIIRLLEVYENRIVPSLSYVNTAGFYGLFDMILNPMFKLSANKEAFFKIKAFDARMLQFDMYFLTMFAAKNTNYKALPEKKLKVWQANVDYMVLHFSSLFAQFAATGDAKWTDIENEFAKCRTHKFSVPNANKFEYRLREECSETTSTNFALKNCQAVENDYADCDTFFALELLNWLLSAKLMIQSVGLYDHFNYFHDYYIPSGEALETKALHGLMVADLRDTRLFIAGYKQLQLVRGELEMQFNDVRTAILNKIVFCANRDFEVTSDKSLEKQKCLFDSDVYGGLFWVLRHAYIVNFGSSTFILDPFNPKLPPMATFNYLVLMVRSVPYREEFEKSCDEAEGSGDYPLICKIKFIVDYWLLKIGEDEKESDPNSGLAKIEAYLNVEKKDIRKSYVETIIANSKTLMIEKFLFIEAYLVTFHILKANSVRLSSLKDDFNYDLYKGTEVNSALAKFYEESNVFEFSNTVNVDEFNMFSLYLRFNFKMRNLFSNDLKIAEAIRGIMKETTVDKDFKIISGKETAVIEILSKFCGAQQTSIYAFFLRYSDTPEDYQKIVGLFFLRKVFLDAVTTQVPDDVYNRAMAMLDDPTCGGGSKAKCFNLFIQQHNLETKGFLEYQIGNDAGIQQTGFEQGNAYDLDPYAQPKGFQQKIVQSTLTTQGEDKRTEMAVEKISYQAQIVTYQNIAIGDINLSDIQIDGLTFTPYTQEVFNPTDQRSNSQTEFNNLVDNGQFLPGQNTEIMGSNSYHFEFNNYDVEMNSEVVTLNKEGTTNNQQSTYLNYEKRTASLMVDNNQILPVTQFDSVSNIKESLNDVAEIANEGSSLGLSGSSKMFTRMTNVDKTNMEVTSKKTGSKKSVDML